MEILFVGAVGRRKGVFDLVSVLDAVRQAVPGTRLRIVGPPATDGVFPQLHTLTKERGLEECVAFAGPLFDAAKIEAFARADLLALPSYDEQFPCALQEAMAAGLPVVTSDVGGIPDMVRHGEHGLVVSAGDLPALTEALIALGDPARRQAMGRAAAAHAAAEYHIDRAVERIAALWDHILESIQPRLVARASAGSRSRC
jgi:glycosyltransferase involved in cell wall biosynthesis